MTTSWNKPRVFISYTWRPAENKARAFKLAEDLRSLGFDVRIDVYFQQSHHGFSPPQPVLGDPRDPWIVWAETEIRGADCVLLLCTEEYAASDRDRAACPGEWCTWHELPYENKLGTKVPYVWWDWHAMFDDWKNGKATSAKYVPAGFGHYSSNRQLIPGFLGNATYCNLESKDDFDGLIRRLKAEHRRKNPRAGVFISYAHDDEPEWIDTLLRHLVSIERSGARIWTDRDIKPGARWHEETQGSLATAKVAVLLVSQQFLSSQYISNHELPNFLQAAASDGLTIFWVPIKPSGYEGTEIADFQAAHSPSQPLSSLRGAKRDAAFVSIAKKLAEALT